MAVVSSHPSLQARPELLAPAGDWDCLRAAVINGADAVYFGLDNFNARHRATNFTMEDLPKVMEYLHSHNVKGYLTFNTLIFSDELEAAQEWIPHLVEAGVDAIIVQDFGLTRLIHGVAPEMPVFGSTQMTLTEPRGIAWVKNLGVQRVILARELSLREIRKIIEAGAGPVEVFVHGAICVAYSGQCLTSESLGGRSANRGQCAQACRLPYDLMVDGQEKEIGEKAYLLSPHDLAAHEVITELAQAGVCSFKIEGRLKSAHYVAATTQTYRAAIDAATQGQTFQVTPQQQLELEQSFSRGFTTGYLRGVNHQSLINARFPKARGTRIGTLAEILPHALVIQLPSASTPTFPLPLKPGDGVVFDEGHPEQDEQGGRVYAARSFSPGRLQIELGHGDVNFAALSVGAIVWKTDDPAVRKRLEGSFSRNVLSHRETVDACLIAHVGQPLRLRLTLRSFTAEVAATTPLQAATKHPLNESMAREQLARLGDTPFELGHLQLDTTGGPMVPKSLLNDLRRQACAQLQSLRAPKPQPIHSGVLENLRQKLSENQKAKSGNTSLTTPTLHILVRSMEQLETVLEIALPEKISAGTVYCDFEDVRRYPEAMLRCRAAKRQMMLATTRIIKPGEEGLMNQLLACRPDGFLVRNLAALSYFREKAPDLTLVGDYALNVANELTAGLLHEAGLCRVTASYDLNWRQMRSMVARTGADLFEMVVHQHMPMFHMEHCVFAHTLSTGTDATNCGRPCERHQVDLRDRVGEKHPLIADVGCRNTLYNAVAQSGAEFIPEMLGLGVRHFRVEMLREPASETKDLLNRYIRVLSGEEQAGEMLHSLRVLQQLGVNRGTLERE